MEDDDGIDLLRLFTEGLKILARFHRLGYVHCDLKPENILARRRASGEDEIVLADLEGERFLNDDYDGNMLTTATGAMKVGSKVSMSMVCTWDFMPLRYVCPHINGATISEFDLLFISVYLPTSCYRYVCTRTERETSQFTRSLRNVPSPTEGKASRGEKTAGQSFA